MPGVFKPESDTNYQAYLNVKGTLTGPHAANFAERLIRYVCWAMDNDKSMGAGPFNPVWDAILIHAKSESRNTNGVSLKLKLKEFEHLNIRKPVPVKNPVVVSKVTTLDKTGEPKTTSVLKNAKVDHSPTSQSLIQPKTTSGLKNVSTKGADYPKLYPATPATKTYPAVPVTEYPDSLYPRKNPTMLSGSSPATAVRTDSPVALSTDSPAPGGYPTTVVDPNLDPGYAEPKPPVDEPIASDPTFDEGYTDPTSKNIVEG